MEFEVKVVTIKWGMASTQIAVIVFDYDGVIAPPVKLPNEVQDEWKEVLEDFFQQWRESNGIHALCTAGTYAITDRVYFPSNFVETIKGRYWMSAIDLHLIAIELGYYTQGRSYPTIVPELKARAIEHMYAKYWHHLDRSQILFLDDHIDNITAVEAKSFQCHHITSIDELRALRNRVFAVSQN